MSFATLARNTGYAFGENRLTLSPWSSWRCWRSAPLFGPVHRAVTIR